MYAYIQFIRDKVKAIVPVVDVKDFDPRHINDFFPTAPYMVRWRGKTVDSQGRVGDSNTHHRAYILRLEETYEALKRSIQEKRPRVPFRKADQEDSTVEEETEFEDNLDENQEAHKDDIAGIISNHQQRVRNGQGILDVASMESGQQSQANDSADRLLAGATDAERYRAKYKLVRDERNALRKENEDLKRLNLALQLKVESLESGGRPVAASEDVNRPPTSALRPDVLAAIHCLNSESRVIKALAVATWGSEDLRERSVLGQKANKTGADPRKPLSPEKVQQIRGEVTTYMSKRGRSDDYQQVVLGNVTKYINEKIQDLRRKKARFSGSHVLAVETQENVVDETVRDI